MKKIYFLFLALAVLAGCGTDTEPAPIPVCGVISLRSESALENTPAPKKVTRANGDAMLVYTCEAWTRDANPRCVLHTTANGSLAAATIEIRLVPGDYDFLFWADYGKGHYTTTDLRRVTVNRTTSVADDRDAFACVKTGVTWNGGGIPVTLVRPLAKLTVQNTSEFAIGDKTVSVVYRNAPTCYDVASGESSVPEEITLSYPSVVAGSAVVCEDFLFVPSDVDVPVGVEVTVSDDRGTVTKGLDAVPLQPNFRTNIQATFE